MKYTHIEQSLFLKVSCVPICTPPCVREGKQRRSCRTYPSRAPARHIYTYALGRHLVQSLHTHMHTFTRTHRHVHMVLCTQAKFQWLDRDTEHEAMLECEIAFFSPFRSFYLVYKHLPSIFVLECSKSMEKKQTQISPQRKAQRGAENMDTMAAPVVRSVVLFGTRVWNVWKRENKGAKIRDEGEMSRRQVLTFSASMEGQRTSAPRTRDEIPKTRSCRTRPVCFAWHKVHERWCERIIQTGGCG